MYARTAFEQSPRASASPHSSSHKFLSSPLLSHRCAHLRPHLLSFDIHPQNTPGWGAPIFTSSPMDPAKSNYSRTYELLPRNSNHSHTYTKQGVSPLPLSRSPQKKKRPRSWEQRRSLLQTPREECRADQLLMSVLASSFASMGSRNTLLASGATAMEAFISLEAVAKSPALEARRACARWLVQWLGSRLETRGKSSKARLASPWR